MGACASVYKTSMKITGRRSKNDRDIIRPESPIKISEPGAVDIAYREVYNADLKDEAFFDSNVWLESDGEDDFYSVRGDFTPSRGNTPVHHLFSVAKPQNDETAVELSPLPAAELSPTAKKSLSELLQDTAMEDKNVEESHDVPNGETDEHVENGEVPAGERDAAAKTGQCCIPMLVSHRSFGERKKMSPARTLTVKA